MANMPMLGYPSLDLIATVGRRWSDEPVERLSVPADLHDWFTRAGISVGEPLTAKHLAAARRLREKIFSAMTSAATSGACDAADVRFLNDQASRGRVPQLEVRKGPPLGQPLDAVTALAVVARDAVGILSSRHDELLICEGRLCGTVVLSRGAGRPRRWCASTTCGNAARVASHRAGRSTRLEHPDDPATDPARDPA